MFGSYPNPNVPDQYLTLPNYFWPHLDGGHGLALLCLRKFVLPVHSKVISSMLVTKVINFLPNQSETQAADLRTQI